MPFVKINKSGRFALAGTRVVALTAGEVLELSQSEHDDIVKTSWAEPTDHVADPDNGGADLMPDDPEPVEDAPSTDVDWDFVSEIAEDGDKSALDDYADTHGVKLDKRKSIEKMVDDFRAAVEAE